MKSASSQERPTLYIRRPLIDVRPFVFARDQVTRALGQGNRKYHPRGERRSGITLVNGSEWRLVLRASGVLGPEDAARVRSKLIGALPAGAFRPAIVRTGEAVDLPGQEDVHHLAITIDSPEITDQINTALDTLNDLAGTNLFQYEPEAHVSFGHYDGPIPQKALDTLSRNVSSTLRVGGVR